MTLFLLPLFHFLSFFFSSPGPFSSHLAIFDATVIPCILCPLSLPACPGLPQHPQALLSLVETVTNPDVAPKA